MANEKNMTNIDDAANDELLREFFAGSARMQVADDGFSMNVMRRVQDEMPARQWLAYNIWTAACAVACVVMFFVSNGIGIIKGCLRGLYGSVAAFVAESMRSMAGMWNTPHADAYSSAPLLFVVMVIVVGGVALYDVAES